MRVHTHQRQVLADDGRGVRQVPVEASMDRRMVEIGERRIDAADRPAETFEQRRRAVADLGERNPGEIRHEAHEMRAAGCETDRLPGNRRQHARADRHATCHVRHRGVLRLEHRAIFSRVRDLEDESVASRGREHEVLVSLAGKGRRAGVEAVQIAREPLRVGKGKPRRLLQHGHAWIITPAPDEARLSEWIRETRGGGDSRAPGPHPSA